MILPKKITFFHFLVFKDKLSLIFSLPLDLRDSQCALIQEVAFNTILGDQPTYVASFGNSDVNSVGDWVKILNSRPVNEVAFLVRRKQWKVE